MTLQVIEQDEGEASFTPSKIVCVGRNYVDHIQELGNEIPSDMVVFVKPNSAIGQNLPSFIQEQIHYETELCFKVENGQFAAVGLGLDLTKRALQSSLKSQQLPWERAKAFDGSAIFSQFISLSTLSLKANASFCFMLTIDDELIQLGHSDLMMYSVDQIHRSISEFMSLVDGDIVMTGTPKGVGEVTKGAVFEMKLWPDIEYHSYEQLLVDVNKAQPMICQSWVAE